VACAPMPRRVMWCRAVWYGAELRRVASDGVVWCGVVLYCIVLSYMV
jgi:hypothetical protein